MTCQYSKPYLSFRYLLQGLPHIQVQSLLSPERYRTIPSVVEGQKERTEMTKEEGRNEKLKGKGIKLKTLGRKGELKNPLNISCANHRIFFCETHIFIQTHAFASQVDLLSTKHIKRCYYLETHLV